MLLISKLYPQTIWGDKYGGDFGALFDAIKAAGISSIIVPMFQGSRLFYPDADGGDEPDAFNAVKMQSMAQDAGIGFIPSFPMFNDADTFTNVEQFRPISIDGDPGDLPDWYHPLCPSNGTFRQFRLNLLSAALQQTAPELINLDFLHYPYTFDMAQPDNGRAGLPRYCYCDFCRHQFAEFAGFSDPTRDIELWYQFRCENVTIVPVLVAEMIEKLGLQSKIMVQMPSASPPQSLETLRRSAGVDIQQWRNIVDILCPQLYLFQSGGGASWAADLLQTVQGATDIQLIPEIDLPFGAADVDELLALDTALETVGQSGVSALSFFHFDLIDGHDDVIEMLSEIGAE